VAEGTGGAAGIKPFKPWLIEARNQTFSDSVKDYILETDVSDHSMGAVLSQVQGGSEVDVAYYSKTLAAAEKYYWTSKKKLLTVVKTGNHF